jgi:hypothetical protein
MNFALLGAGLSRGSRTVRSSSCEYQLGVGLGWLSRFASSESNSNDSKHFFFPLHYFGNLRTWSLRPCLLSSMSGSSNLFSVSHLVNKNETFRTGYYLTNKPLAPACRAPSLAASMCCRRHRSPPVGRGHCRRQCRRDARSQLATSRDPEWPDLERASPTTARAPFLPWMLQDRVASVCFKRFRCFVCML